MSDRILSNQDRAIELQEHDQRVKFAVHLLAEDYLYDLEKYCNGLDQDDPHHVTDVFQDWWEMQDEKYDAKIYKRCVEILHQRYPEKFEADV